MTHITREVLTLERIYMLNVLSCLNHTRANSVYVRNALASSGIGLCIADVSKQVSFKVAFLVVHSLFVILLNK